MRTKEAIVQNIVIAMRMCGVCKMTEGAVYWALFQQNMTADEATDAVKYAIENGILIRTGYVLALKEHGKEDTSGPRAVCNS